MKIAQPAERFLSAPVFASPMRISGCDLMDCSKPSTTSKAPASEDATCAMSPKWMAIPQCCFSLQEVTAIRHYANSNSDFFRRF
jgi:hypothetical protein